VADNIILVASVQNTGTWFVIDFLQSHPDVKHFSELIHILDEHEDLASMYSRCEHNLADKFLASQFKMSLQEVLPDNEISLLHHHIVTSHWSTRRACWVNWNNSFGSLLGGISPTIIPVRDPLMSLITGYRRSEVAGVQFDFISRLSCFSFWTDLSWAPGPSIFFFPIDLYTTREAREELLNDTLTMCGLPSATYVSELAATWVPQNTVGDYEMKRWYLNGDVKKIEAAIPRCFSALRLHEQTFRPFLEHLGYKNLLWWS
jgi:hypothetical protein